MADPKSIEDGGAPKPVEPSSDGQLIVRGGVGGIAFQYEELLHGANGLHNAGEELNAAKCLAEAVRSDLLAYLVDSPVSGAFALAMVSAGIGELSSSSQGLYRIAADVRASHRDYESSEARAAALLRMGLSYPAVAERLNLFSGLDADRKKDQAGLRNLTEQAIARAPHDLVNHLLPGLGPVAAALLSRTTGGKDARGVLRFLSDLPFASHLKPRPVEAKAVSTDQRKMDLTLPGIIRELETAGAHHGEVEVVRVERPDGPVFVLLIPGTQTGEGIGGDNPLDPAGIVDGLGYDSQEINQGIRKALQEAGAEAGARIVAVAHSQGGIHAMNLGQDKAFLAEFDLKYVVTAGSPVGGIKPKEGIGVLNLEHGDDFVPGTEGLPNPDTKDRVTVTLTDTAVLEPGEEVGLGPAHKLEIYAQGAERILKSSDPSLVAASGTVAGLLGTSGVASVTRVKLSRAPMPSPAQSNPDQPVSAPSAGALAGPK